MRPTKLTPETEEQILNAVSAGSALIHAARAAGTTAETAKSWVKRGEAGQEPYKSFVAKLRVAEATPRTHATRAWYRAMDDDWRAAKAFLEYLDRQATSPANVSRQLEDILQVVEDELGKEEAKRVLRAIVKRFGGEEAGEPGAALRLVRTE